MDSGIVTVFGHSAASLVALSAEEVGVCDFPEELASNEASNTRGALAGLSGLRSKLTVVANFGDAHSSVVFRKELL